MDIIEASHISKSFGALQVLKDISLTIRKGEIVTIVGASGAGKTTLLQIMGTLMSAGEGTIAINGTVTGSLRERELSRFRNRHIGFVFQFHHLLPEFTALENVCIPAFIAGQPKQATLKKAASLLEFLSLDHRRHHKPSELSGGEQQRVAVARALINDPAVVLADEPSGNLDTRNKRDLHDLFFTLRKQFSQTFVIVTHDTELAGMSDRTVTMQDGRILGTGD